jgi:hypothetical protein
MYPRAYLRGLRRLNIPGFLAPVDKDGFFRVNRSATAAAAQWFDAFDSSRATRLTLALGLSLALCAAFARTMSAGERMSLALALVTIGWVLVAAIFGEYGENSRFRYKVLWLGWTLAIAGYAAAFRWTTWGLEDAIDFFRTRRAASLAPAPTISTSSSE